MTNDPFATASLVEQHRAELIASARHAHDSRLAKSARSRRRFRIKWHRTAHAPVGTDGSAAVRPREAPRPAN
jgi:hypothetical protein